MVLLAVLLTACGGSNHTAAACQGLPTAAHTAPPLVLFGALDKLDRRFLCTHFGRPTSIEPLSGGRQSWRYDGNTFILRHGHVIAYHQAGGPSSKSP